MKLPTDAAEPVVAPVTTSAESVVAHRSPGRTFTWVVVAATALAAANALIGIGSASVARDEGFSISTSLRSWSSLVRLSLHTETNAWLYAFVLKAWSALGTSPAMLRVPSSAAFAVSVVLAALIARRLFGDRVGMITAGLVAVNGAMLMFANQIRGYSFAVAFALGATLVFLAEVRRPRTSTLVGWMVLALLAAQCQLHTFAVIVPHLVALVALPAPERRWRRRLGAAAVGAVVLAPLAWAISNNEEGQGLFSLRLGVFRDVLYTFSGRGGVLGVLTFVAGGVALVALLRSSWRRPSGTERFAATLLAAWIVAPFLGLLVASLVLQPTLIGRYLLYCVPAMAILLALLIDRVISAGWPRTASVCAAVLLVGGGLRGSVSWHLDSHTEQWDHVAAYVFSQARADDRLVLANDSVRLFFEYERTRQHGTPAGPLPGYPAEPWGAYGTGDQRYLSPSVDELTAVAAEAPRLWVVVGHHHVDAEVMPSRLNALEGRFRLVDRRTFPNEIDVLLYERVTS